jgi:hypothetical protein
MHDERARLEPDNQVFRAPLDPPDELPADGGFETCCDGPTQAAIADDHVNDAMAHECGRDAASRGFYFRKLGQRLNRLFDLRFFVSDVLAHHGVEFLRLELVGMQAFVFGGRVVMTGAGGRNQLDLVAHVQPLKP